jgi:tetratricopeptide (TPR) repeat protein
VIVALAVGLGVALWQATVARNEAARANTIKDFVLSIIQQADPVASRQTREADVALLTTAEARIDKELEKQPELALQMQRAIGAAYRNRGEYLRASAVLRKGIEQARTTLPPDNLELLGAYVQIAEDRVIDRHSVLTDLESAIEILRKLGPNAQTLLADGLLARLRGGKYLTLSVEQVKKQSSEAYRAARATGDAGRMLDAASEGVETCSGLLMPPEALPAIAEARQYAEQDGRIEPTDPRWIAATAFHGVALCVAGQDTEELRQARAAEGLELAKSAVTAAQTHHGADSRVNEIALFSLALTRRCADDAKGALEPMRQAHAIAIKREPPGSMNRVWRTIFLIDLLFELDQHDEVKRVLRDTPLWDPTPGAVSTSPTYAASVMRLWEAMTRFRLGDTEAAERVIEEAVPQIAQEAAPIVVEPLFRVLAQALYQNGKFARAESFMLKVLGQHEKVEVERGEDLFLLSLIRLELADYEGAIEAADRALVQSSVKGTPPDGAVARFNYRRGRALLGMGRYAEAVEALSTAHAYWQERPGAPGAGSYWYGQALIASGDPRRGQALVNDALPVLASSDMPRDRALATDEARKRTEAAAMAGRR